MEVLVIFKYEKYLVKLTMKNLRHVFIKSAFLLKNSKQSCLSVLSPVH